MTYALVKTLRGYQPIYGCRDGVILFRRDRLYLASHDLAQLRLVATLPSRHPVIARFGPRIVQRILRTGVTGAIMPDEDSLFVVRRDQVFRICLSSGACTLDFTIPDGRRALNLALIRDSRAEAACFLAFGEYFDNPEKKPVRIWRRGLGSAADWTVATTFGAGEINHVHAICEDSTGAVRVLTGDFGDGAGIWITAPDFSTLTPLARGSQAFRACWLREMENGELYYATDSQFDANHLYRFDGAGGTIMQAGIEGSSIYSAQGDGAIFFSTTVEPGEASGNVVRDIWDRRPGPGIKSANAVIYAYKAGCLKEVLRAPKDFWPMRLAQFGTFLFPQGRMPADRFYAYGNAVQQFDDVTLCFARKP